MKRVLLFLFAAAAAANSFLAYDFKRGDLYYTITNSDAYEVMVDKNSTYSFLTTCNIPASVTYNNNVYSVTSIGEMAFYGCSSLTSLTIPDNVQYIDRNAFGKCTGLTSVHMTGAKTISSTVFEGCSNITKLLCDGILSVETPSTGMLATLQSLDTVVVNAEAFDAEESNGAVHPKNIRYIKVHDGELTDNAFNVIVRNYKTIGTLDLTAATNTTLSDKAFQECYNLHTLCLPSGLTSIPYKAVADCQLLKSIVIPATVTEIDNSAFENCRSIQSIIFEGENVAPSSSAKYYARSSSPESALRRIGNWAFYNCHELQHLDIPEGVTEIGDGAFYGCIYLEDMVLPSTIQQIGDNTFAGCAKLQKITMHATTPPSICAKTFHDVNRRIPVYVPATSVSEYNADEYWKEFNIIGYNAPTSTVNPTADPTTTPQKVLRNGQVYILRNGHTYTLSGQEVAE